MVGWDDSVAGWDGMMRAGAGGLLKNAGGVLTGVAGYRYHLGSGWFDDKLPDDTAGVEMSSSYIGKVDKARKYAEEPDRVHIQTMEATFTGNHNTYRVRYHDGDWQCECAFFATRGICSHIMALQRMLDEMLAGQAAQEGAAV